MYPYKWATIAKNLKGRTENAVKIRFKSLTRTLERKRKRAKAKESEWSEKGATSSSEDVHGSGSGSWPHTTQPVKRKATPAVVKLEQQGGPVQNPPQPVLNGRVPQRAPVIGHEATVTLSLLDMYIMPNFSTPFNYLPSPSHMVGTPYLLAMPVSNPAAVHAGTSFAPNGHCPTMVPVQQELNSGRSNRQRKNNDKQITVRFNGSESWPNKYQMTPQGRVIGFPECGPEAEESSFSISVLVKDVEATRGKVFDLYVEFCLFDAEGSVKVDNILKKEDIAKLLRTEERPRNAWIRGEYRSRAIKSGEIVYEYTIKTGCGGWVYGDHFVEHPLAESGAVNRHSLRAYVLFRSLRQGNTRSVSKLPSPRTFSYCLTRTGRGR